MEHDFVNKSESDLEVDAESADDPDKDNGQEELFAREHIAKAFARVCPPALKARAGNSSAGRIMTRPAMTARNEAALPKKAQAVPTPSMSRPAAAGPKMRAALNVGAVEADCVRELVGADQLGHEGLAGRVVERGCHPKKECEQVDVIERRRAAQVEQPEPEGQKSHRHLSRQDQLALGEAVGDHSALQAEKQDREELQPGRDPDRRPAVVAEAQHQPVLAHTLHPAACERDELAACEQPVVTDPK